MLKSITEIRKAYDNKSLMEIVNRYLVLLKIESLLTAQFEAVALHQQQKDVILECDKAIEVLQFETFVESGNAPANPKDDLRNVKDVNRLHDILEKMPSKVLDSAELFCQEHPEVSDQNVQLRKTYLPLAAKERIFDKTLANLLTSELKRGGYDFDLTSDEHQYGSKFIPDQLYHSNLTTSERFLTLKVPYKQFTTK